MKFLSILLIALLIGSGAFAQPVGIISGATPIIGGSTGQCVTKGSDGTATLGACASGTVTTFSGGSTGFTPSSATGGAITLAGLLIGANGGTGVANTGKTITLGGNLTTAGAFNTTLTATAGTSITLPTTGTLATLAGSEALTNKTINGLTITSGTGTLSLANGSTITTSGAFNSTLSASGSYTYTLPTASSNIACASAQSMVSGNIATVTAAGCVQDSGLAPVPTYPANTLVVNNTGSTTAPTTSGTLTLAAGSRSTPTYGGTGCTGCGMYFPTSSTVQISAGSWPMLNVQTPGSQHNYYDFEANNGHVLYARPGDGSSSTNLLLTTYGTGGTAALCVNSGNTCGVTVSNSAITLSLPTTIAQTSKLDWSGRSAIKSSADGSITLLNNAQTGFTSLLFGGTTSSFPAFKRNSAALNVRLADDSADAAITASSGTFSTTLKTGGYTVSTLPAGIIGMRAYVTDQTVACPATGTALTGNGAVVCPAFYNGSAWVGG